MRMPAPFKVITIMAREEKEGTLTATNLVFRLFQDHSFEIGCGPRYFIRCTYVNTWPNEYFMLAFSKKMFQEICSIVPTTSQSCRNI
jgi:hypothetical protein